VVAGPVAELNLEDVFPTTMYVDNTAAVALTVNSCLHSRTKHCALDMCFVREKVLAGRIMAHSIPTRYQTADFLTKSLLVEALTNCCAGAGLRMSPRHPRGSVE
jgi:hypothetical protein